MRTALLMAFTIAVTACGQTGSLYLPDESVETPDRNAGAGADARG